MKWILLIMIYAFSTHVHAKQLKVAVIDTGIQQAYLNKANLCKTEHKSFIPGEGLDDKIGHGTNIVGLINEYAGKDADYCIVLIKFYSQKSNNTLKQLVSALKYAHSIKPDIINLSGGGITPFPIEARIIQNILNDDIKLIVAAGNESANLDKTCNYFPACYDKRIWVISAKDFPSANQGKVVDSYIDGKDRTGFGVKLTGTSHSTAIFTGRVIRNLSRDKR